MSNLDYQAWTPMRLALALALTAPLGGCATTLPADAPGERTVSFDCGDHPGITVIFAGDEARVRDAQGGEIRLPRRPAASGFLYETPTHALRGQGDDLTYTIGRMAPISCRAIRGGTNG